MMRVRAVVSGWSGGPGLSTFYFTDATEGLAEAGHCVTRVRAALVAIAQWLPNSCSYQISPDVDIVNPIDGKVTDTLSGGTSAPVVGTSAGSSFLPTPVAGVIRLKTSTFLAGRRLQGRIFISPMATATNTAAGIPLSTLPLDAEAFIQALLDTGSTSPLSVIWRRPRKAKPLAVPPVTARDGATGRLTSGSFKPTWGVLRSRRQ